MNGPEIGGINDPVAQNIRREQNMNAMPSAEEMAGPECDECGEKPTKPVMNPRYAPACPAYQTAHEPEGHYCDDCRPEQETKAEAARRKLDAGATHVIEYGCGALSSIVRDEEYDGEYEPTRRWSPTVALEHERCGATLEAVWTGEDFDDE